jgi:hypothetical protein
VRADIGQPQRARLADEDAEHAAAPREIADRTVRLLVDADCEEALEGSALIVENAESRVPRVCELASRVQHALQHGLQIEFRDESAAGVDQPFEAALTLVGRGGPCDSIRSHYWPPSLGTIAADRLGRGLLCEEPLCQGVANEICSIRQPELLHDVRPVRLGRPY